MVNYKQVILVRQDKASERQVAAQCCHASIEAALKSSDKKISAWRKEGMAKIVLKVKDEKELLHYLQKAEDKSLIAALITDAGKTVVAPGTRTCGAIGPDDEEEIDKITGSLPLL